jgi:hypothetical protein
VVHGLLRVLPYTCIILSMTSVNTVIGLMTLQAAHESLSAYLWCSGLMYTCMHDRNRKT